MRMWGVDPSVMCRKHLMGEHLEIHMFIGAILKGKSIQGFIDGGLLEVHNIAARHKQLVEEIERRGYKHTSSLVRQGWTRGKRRRQPLGKLNVPENLEELARRCDDCRKLQENK